VTGPVPGTRAVVTGAHGGLLAEAPRRQAFGSRRSDTEFMQYRSSVGVP
jgi:hypothetical protein